MEARIIRLSTMSTKPIVLLIIQVLLMISTGLILLVQSRVLPLDQLLRDQELETLIVLKIFRSIARKSLFLLVAAIFVNLAVFVLIMKPVFMPMDPQLLI